MTKVKVYGVHEPVELIKEPEPQLVRLRIDYATGDGYCSFKGAGRHDLPSGVANILWNPMEKKELQAGDCCADRFAKPASYPLPNLTRGAVPPTKKSKVKSTRFQPPATFDFDKFEASQSVREIQRNMEYIELWAKLSACGFGKIPVVVSQALSQYRLDPMSVEWANVERLRKSNENPNALYNLDRFQSAYGHLHCIRECLREMSLFDKNRSWLSEKADEISGTLTVDDETTERLNLIMAFHNSNGAILRVGSLPKQEQTLPGISNRDDRSTMFVLDPNIRIEIGPLKPADNTDFRYGA